MTDTTTTCDWCEREFEPQPHNFVETGFIFHTDDAPNEENFAFLRKELENLSEHAKNELMDALHLTEDQFQELKQKGPTDKLCYSCVCDECQEACEDEQDD